MNRTCAINLRKWAFLILFEEIPAIAPASNLAALRQICNGVSKKNKGPENWAHIITGMTTNMAEDTAGNIATATHMDQPLMAAPLQSALCSIPALSQWKRRMGSFQARWR